MSTAIQSLITACVLLLLGGAIGHAQTDRSSAAVRGDQLIFFYDTTGTRVSFLVASNASGDDVLLEIAWYSQGLSEKLATTTTTIPGGGNQIFDPSGISGVPGNLGLAVLTPIRSVDDPTPVVPAQTGGLLREDGGPLSGTSTIVDAFVGSGLALSPIARNAVTSSGEFPPVGAVVDGTTVRYERLSAAYLVAPGFFDHGNPDLTSRAALALFDDVYGPGGFSLAPRAENIGLTFIGADGQTMAGNTLRLNGVEVGSLESLAATNLAGSGKAVVTVEVAGNFFSSTSNFVGFSSQSLGTFAVGGILPGIGVGDILSGDVLAGNELDLTWTPERLGRFDESTGVPDPDGTDIQYGQTFTSGRRGRITRVFVAVGNDSRATEPLTLEIRRLSGAGVPADDRSVLRSISLDASEIGPLAEAPLTLWPSFDLGAHPVDVEEGERIAFSLRTHDGRGYQVALEVGSGLPGETAVSRDFPKNLSWAEQNRDLGFFVLGHP